MMFFTLLGAGSDTLAPTKPENYALSSYVAHDVREEDEDGNFCTGDWGFSEAVRKWFPVENIIEEPTYDDE